MGRGFRAGPWGWGGSNSELPVHGYTMAGMSMLGSLEDQARRSKAKRADW